MAAPARRRQGRRGRPRTGARRFRQRRRRPRGARPIRPGHRGLADEGSGTRRKTLLNPMQSLTEIQELLARFEKGRDALAERLKQEPDDDEARDFLQDAEEAIGTLGPIIEAYERGDDPELEKYSEILDELAEEETDLAQKLES